MSQEKTRTIPEQSSLPQSEKNDALISQLASAAVDVGEEIEAVTRERASLEEIEGTKARAAEVLHQYDALLNRLGPTEANRLQQNVGPAIEDLKKGLVQLKEAPE